MLLASSHASVCSRWLLCEAGVGSIQKVQQSERMEVESKKRKVGQAMGPTPEESVVQTDVDELRSDALEPIPEESVVQTDDDGFEMEEDGVEDSVALLLLTPGCDHVPVDADHTQSLGLAGGPLWQEMKQREEERAVGAEVQEKPEGKKWWQMDGHQFVTRGSRTCGYELTTLITNEIMLHGIAKT